MSFLHTLAKISENPRLENEFLELLSLLEYVGCRKILKGVPVEKVSVDVLVHIQEESLHALMLRRLVDKPSGVPWSESLFAPMGWEYFRQLDKRVSTEVSPSYEAVSWAIEQRALSLYPDYFSLTTREDVKKVLSTIIAQEKRHAIHFAAAEATRWLEIEGELWAEFEARVAAIVQSL
ncbi:MAG: ferritin-like domain-containing protein [Deltaproteobacteria bacterium]|nr:ferritin-like domain-containing protein [Deltaproteobacteria bacterium]MBI3294507.1 ferritin-like domain-containing protein [Deltaproteobacteria bacterium]